MKLYWVSLLIQDTENSKPWLSAMSSGCVSLEEAMRRFQMGLDFLLIRKGLFYARIVILYTDGSIVYKTEPHNQCKCTLQIIKTTRKLTWNDIYKIVNSVKPAPYSFNGFLS